MEFPRQMVWFDHIYLMLALSALLSVKAHYYNILFHFVAHVLIYKNNCNVWSIGECIEGLFYFSIWRVCVHITINVYWVTCTY